MSLVRTWGQRLVGLVLGLTCGVVQAQATLSPRELIDGFSLAFGDLAAVTATAPQPAPLDVQALRTTEAALAAQLRQSIALAPDDAQLTARDELGRTPLMRAALYGYADIVEALLTSPKVRAEIEVRDALDATAWQLAQFARPITLKACHSLRLAAELAPLWQAQQGRAAYFSRDAETAFDRISLSLVAAGAVTDLAGARAAWRRQCPGSDTAVSAAVDAAPDLLKALLDVQATRADKSAPHPADAALPFSQWPKAAFPTYLPGRAALPKPDGQPLCTHTPAPQLKMRLPASVQFRTQFSVQAGRATISRTWIVKADEGLYPVHLKLLLSTINEALAQYRCRGDFVSMQDFGFWVE